MHLICVLIGHSGIATMILNIADLWLNTELNDDIN